MSDSTVWYEVRCWAKAQVANIQVCQEAALMKSHSMNPSEICTCLQRQKSQFKLAIREKPQVVLINVLPQPLHLFPLTVWAFTICQSDHRRSKTQLMETPGVDTNPSCHLQHLPKELLLTGYSRLMLKG